MEEIQVWAGSAWSTPGPSKQPMHLSDSSYRGRDFQENQEASDLGEATLLRSHSKSGVEVETTLRASDTQVCFFPGPPPHTDSSYRVQVWWEGMTCILLHNGQHNARG